MLCASNANDNNRSQQRRSPLITTERTDEGYVLKKDPLSSVFLQCYKEIAGLE